MSSSSTEKESFYSSFIKKFRNNDKVEHKKLEWSEYFYPFMKINPERGYLQYIGIGALSALLGISNLLVFYHFKWQ